ncbi:histidine kinase [Leptospira gomenensis]|uniref:histidine kinase n=1 Tax=Leptospira gomenensis TaxID=2484974 RepID=A0A5F1Y7P0_9LEPT|nr:sensor histidine kinase [Leptospira gomenensis]TGK29086.1 histidine kinase [Leptospira gomenensis]TGK41950.1 histidine kinase [Leptospira gomenensis]TGK42535.1 histidine kinase [Leptospira gomenensis]TGK67380.1 histidine kinase [Leptospira gomenensis]
MKFPIRINFFLSLAVAIASVSGCVERPYSEKFHAQKGTLDLRHWNPAFDGNVPLKGDWKFAWKQLLSTAENESETEKFIFVKSPSVWNGTVYFGERVSDHGYATYRLKLLLPQNETGLALSIPDLGTSYRLFANGRLIAEAGKVGTTKTTSNAQYLPQIVDLPDVESLDLVLYVSNFQNRWGGYWFPIHIGSLDRIVREKQGKTALVFAVCASAAIMAIYNLLFFVFRRKDPAPLFFSIHCILIFARALTTDERFAYVLFSELLSWEFLNRLEYVTVYLSAPVLYSFLYRFCPVDLWRRFGIFFNLPFFVCATAAAFLPNELYTLTLGPLGAYAAFTTIPLWVFMLFYGIRKRYEGAMILFLGYAGMTICTLNDILYAEDLIDSVYMIQYGQLFLIASHALLLSKRFSNSLNRSETLSFRMKTLVSSTRDIMKSPTFSSATRTTLEILSRNVRETSEKDSLTVIDRLIGKKSKNVSKNSRGFFIYLPENSSASWKQYSIDTNNDLAIQEVSGLLTSYSLDLENLTSPIVLGERLLLPVRNTTTSFVVLDLPIGNYFDSDSEMDWVQGIAYALALSIQNLLRQDREKLAIIGELSAEIAHDIGHHVVLIRKVLYNLQKNGSSRQNDIAQAQKETEALANLSLDILEFSKKRIILDLKSVKVGDFFAEIREDLELFFQGSGIRLECEIVADGEIKLDPFRIRRLILNIAKNAADAIGENGRFSVRVEKESGALYIVLKDDGPGLSREIKEAFYHSSIETQKPQGAGLGLFIVRKIAIAHGGEVFIDSEFGQGSKFTVLLPC